LTDAAAASKMAATYPSLEEQMAKKTRLTEAAVKIGTAVGKAERAARTTRKAAQESQKELKKKIEALRRELKKTKKRMARAIASVRG